MHVTSNLLVPILIIMLICLLAFFVIIYFASKKMIKAQRNYSLNKSNFLKSCIYAVVSFIGFYAIIALVEYIEYSDFISLWLVKQYLPIALIGTIAIAIRLWLFGAIFFGGAVGGYIAQSLVVISQQQYITMTGAFLNMAIVAIAFLVGIIVEFTVQRKVRKTKKGNANLSL